MAEIQRTDLQEVLILPRSGRYSDPRRSGEILPIVYGDCTEGGDGGVWTCPCLDKTNHVYAVAAHPVLSEAQGNTVRVFDSDNQEISFSGYVFNPDHDFESQGRIATLTFSSDQSTAEPLSIRVKGKAEDGALIENPIEVVIDYLRSWVGVGEDEIDQTWATRLKTYLEGLGLSLAGVISTDARPDLTLSAMLRLMASWWRAGSGRLVFRPHLGAGGVLESDVVAHLNGRQLDFDSLKVVYDEDQICTRAAVYYAYNSATLTYEEFDGGGPKAAKDKEARYGKAYQGEFELPWVRSPAAVETLQELIGGHYGSAPALLQAEFKGHNQIHLEQGDVVGVSVDWLLDGELNPLKNQLFRLISLDCTLEPGTPGRLEAVDLGIFLTQAYPADGGCEARGDCLAGGERDTTQHA